MKGKVVFMATAKEQAQTNLGDIRDYVNYAGYDKERSIAQNTYDTTLRSMKNEYDTLVNTINANRQQLNRDFTSGRSGVADTYYSNQRLLTPTRSRVLKGTGLSNLGGIINRMKVGNELSGLANEFYSGIDEINAKLKSGELNYDIGQRTAKNTLDAALADIGARQKGGENDYNTNVAQLAEQIQSRWDSNANAQAELALQRSSLAQQVRQYEDNRLQQTLAYASELAGDNYSSSDYKNKYDAAFRYYKFMYPNSTDAEVTKALENAGIYAPASTQAAGKKGYGIYSDTKSGIFGENVPTKSIQQAIIEDEIARMQGKKLY